MQTVFTFIWLVAVIVAVTLFAGFICAWFVLDALVKFLESAVNK